MQSEPSSGRTPSVSVIVVTYNSQEDIVECVHSILNQDYKNIEIVIVDNDSGDGTVQALRTSFQIDEPDSNIKLILNSENAGYSGGNNLGFVHSTGEMIVILNPDCVVDNHWLTALLESYYSHATDAGIVCSNVLLYEATDTINACGNEIHITGLVFSRYYKEPITRCSEGSCRVAAPSGASMMFSRHKVQSVLGRKVPFDASRFFMEYSDIDLAIEFQKRDQHCYVCHSSKIFHKHKFKMTSSRMYYLETGRYQLLGHFTLRTIVLLLPALILTEVIVWAFLANNPRIIGSKLRAVSWSLRHWRSTRRSDNNRTNDLALITSMVPDIVIYPEITGNNQSDLMRWATKQLSGFFSFSKDFILNSLSN